MDELVVMYQIGVWLWRSWIDMDTLISWIAPVLGITMKSYLINIGMWLVM